MSRRCCTVGQVRVICCLKLSFTNPVKTCLVISLPFSHFQYECIIILDSMLDTLKWKSLQHRRRDARLHMLYKTHHEDVATCISKEERLIPPETCIHYLSKYHPAAATIESIPSSHELSEIGICYLQTQQPPQHLLLSKHKLANFHIRKWNCT